MGLGTVLDFNDWRIWDWNDKISSVKLFPFADPGGPYFGVIGRNIPLTGANRCYGDGEAGVTFTWSVDSDACAFSNPTARQPTLICDEEGVYMIDLRVIEGSDESSTIPTTVTVYNFQLFLPLIQ